MSTTTHPSFNAQTTATEVARAFPHRIKNKTFLITGVSPTSLGAAIALALASQSPRLLVLASRTAANLSVVADRIHVAFPTVRVEVVRVDLADSESVRGAAGVIKGVVGQGGVDGLFNNAGVNATRRRLVRWGRKGGEVDVEMQFATNHLGAFLLTGLLGPVLRGRVVMTSSEAHVISPVRFSDFNQEPGKIVDREDEPRRGLPEGILRNDGGYEPAVAYGQSKTANILMAVGLNPRLRSRGVESFAVMPGTIMTDLARDFDEASLKALTSSTAVWKDLDQGAATMLVAALDPKLKSENGVYLDDCQIRRPAKWAVDPVKAERLWKLSEDLVGERFNYGTESKL